MIYALGAWITSGILCVLICVLIYVRALQRFHRIVEIHAPRSYKITALAHARLPIIMSIAHALFTLGAGDLYFQVIHGDVGRITDTAMFIVGMWLHVIALYLFYRDDIIASKLALGE